MLKKKKPLTNFYLFTVEEAITVLIQFDSFVELYTH